MCDLPEMLERRSIRVLISYSKSNFFHDGARPRGFEVELQAEPRSLGSSVRQRG